jgi:hypothetical protein
MKYVVLRGEVPPDDTAVVIRAGERGLSDETLRRTAEVSQAEYGFFGVSVFVALDVDVTTLCASTDYLRRYVTDPGIDGRRDQIRRLRPPRHGRSPALRHRVGRPRRRHAHATALVLPSAASESGAVVELWAWLGSAYRRGICGSTSTASTPQA